MKFKKIFLIPYWTLDGLFNDTTHNSLRWIYRSVKIDWTKKKPVEYIVLPPSRGVRTMMPYSDDWPFEFSIFTWGSHAVNEVLIASGADICAASKFFMSIVVFTPTYARRVQWTFIATEYLKLTKYNAWIISILRFDIFDTFYVC